MFFGYGAGIVSDCIFANNHSGSGGGGLCIGGSDPIVTNCLFIENSAALKGGGIRIYDYSTPWIVNCTVARNVSDQGGGGINTAVSTPVILSSIIWDNQPKGLGVLGTTPDVTYCLLQEYFAGDGNIFADPVFVAGSGGGFYLSHLAAGDPTDSPAIDAGHAEAETECYESSSGQVCMDELTTRTDDLTDSGPVDMGFHYYQNTTAPTPTPTVPPTPTPACDTLGCGVFMPASVYRAGDDCFCDMILCNPGGAPLTNIAILGVVEVLDLYYWFLTQNMEELPTGETTIRAIPAFTWPGGAGSGVAGIWAVMIDAWTMELVGEYDFFEFSWE